MSDLVFPAFCGGMKKSRAGVSARDFLECYAVRREPE